VGTVVRWQRKKLSINPACLYFIEFCDGECASGRDGVSVKSLQQIRL
jgi:hypothetical protein